MVRHRSLASNLAQVPTRTSAKELLEIVQSIPRNHAAARTERAIGLSIAMTKQ